MRQSFSDNTTQFQQSTHLSFFSITYTIRLLYQTNIYIITFLSVFFWLLKFVSIVLPHLSLLVHYISSDNISHIFLIVFKSGIRADNSSRLIFKYCIRSTVFETLMPQLSCRGIKPSPIFSLLRSKGFICNKRV